MTVPNDLSKKLSMKSCGGFLLSHGDTLEWVQFPMENQPSFVVWMMTGGTPMTQETSMWWHHLVFSLM